MLASDEMHLTPNAHQIGYATAFEIPMPSYRAPAKAVHTERRRLRRGERTPQVAA